MSSSRRSREDRTSKKTVATHQEDRSRESRGQSGIQVRVPDLIKSDSHFECHGIQAGQCFFHLAHRQSRLFTVPRKPAWAMDGVGGRGRDDRWDDHQQQEVASTKSKQSSAFGTIPGTTPRASPAGRRRSERQDETRRPAIQNPSHMGFCGNKTAKGNRNGFLGKK